MVTLARYNKLLRESKREHRRLERELATARYETAALRRTIANDTAKVVRSREIVAAKEEEAEILRAFAGLLHRLLGR